MTHGEPRHEVGCNVFTTSLQSSAMIICSHAVTVASLTVEGALQALPTQHSAMFSLMQSERSARIAQAPAF